MASSEEIRSLSCEVVEFSKVLQRTRGALASAIRAAGERQGTPLPTAIDIECRTVNVFRCVDWIVLDNQLHVSNSTDQPIGEWSRTQLDASLPVVWASDVVVVFTGDGVTNVLDAGRNAGCRGIGDPPSLYRLHIQWEMFLRELPTLIAVHRGRWAVYLDGLRHVCDDQGIALDWAYAHLQHDAGFVIAMVETPYIARVRW